jgi:hypothetical protein
LSANIGDFRFWTASGAAGSETYAERLTIRGDSGNIGIGTNAPNAALDINGNAIVQTNLTVNQVIYFKTNSVVTAPAAGFGGMYIDATTNYWFWHPNAGGAGPGWTNKLW